VVARYKESPYLCHVAEPADLSDGEAQAVRIGRAWRELRRGGMSAEFRDRVYGAEGLDVGQADALELLVLGGGCRMAELAAALRVDASTATRAVQRLVDAGYALRTAVPEDARGVTVVATDAGRAAHEEVAGRRRAAILAMTSVFDDREREQLAALLERLVAALDEYVT
jgi:DNA-binding MarR family transcriptional regulator